MKVLVVAPCAETPRCDAFYDCFYNLFIPEGSERRRLVSSSAEDNLNFACKYAIENEFTHLFILDDDQMFPPDILLNLLKHDVDVVIGLYLMREYPFRPVIFDQVLDDGQVKFSNLKDNGLIEIQSAGNGGLLIKTSILDKISKPYFASCWSNGTRFLYDINFYAKLRSANIKIYCDTTQILWHAIRASIAPVFKDGVWKTTIRIGNLNLEIPAPGNGLVLSNEP